MSGAAASDGDIMYYDGPIWERLAKGTAGQVLKMNSGATAPEWGNAGAFEYIGEVVASNDSAVAFTGLSSDYAMYQLRFFGVAPITDNQSLRMRVSSDNGSSYDSGASDYQDNRYANYTGSAAYAVGTTSYHTITNGQGSAANEYAAGYIDIYNPSEAAYTFFNSRAFYSYYTGGTAIWEAGTIRTAATSIDAFQIYCGSGNIDEGTFKLYGLRAS